jgi:DNA-binding response OmpR family regulator
MPSRVNIPHGDSVGLAVAALEQRTLPGPRVLVVDRDNLQRVIICRAADRAGCIPAGAANLAEATRQLQSTAFDGVTLDLSFGREAVCDFLRHLGAVYCKSKIFVTAHGDAAGWLLEVMHQATLHGLDAEDDIVVKPLDIEILRRAFEQLRGQGALHHHSDEPRRGPDPGGNPAF